MTVLTPMLAILEGNGSLGGTDQSGAFTATGAGALRYAPASGARWNYAVNSSFENASLFSVTARTGATVTKSSEQAYSGSNSLKIVSAAGSTDSGANGIGQLVSGVFGVGQTYTFSCYVYSAVATSIKLVVEEKTAVPFYLAGTTSSPMSHTGSGWERFSVSRTLANAGVNALHLVVIVNDTTSRTIYVDAAQLELGGSPAAYLDGASTGAVWLDPITGVIGTAHASPSVNRGAFETEEATTNLVTNPWRATNNSGYSASNGSTARSTLNAYQGPASGLLTATGANCEEVISITAASTSHTAQAIVRNRASATRQCQLVYNGSLIGSPSNVPAGATATITAPFTGTGSAANLGVRWIDSANTETFATLYLGAEAKTYATSPCPAVNSSGTIQSGYSWSGTAHASTSTRTASSVSAATSSHLTPSAGALALNYVRLIDTGAEEIILACGAVGAGTDAMRAGIDASDHVFFEWNSNNGGWQRVTDSATIAVNTLTQIALGWSGTTQSLKVGSGSKVSGSRAAVSDSWGSGQLVISAATGGHTTGRLTTWDRELTSDQITTVFAAMSGTGALDGLLEQWNATLQPVDMLALQSGQAIAGEAASIQPIDLSTLQTVTAEVVTLRGQVQLTDAPLWRRSSDESPTAPSLARHQERKS